MLFLLLTHQAIQQQFHRDHAHEALDLEAALLNGLDMTVHALQQEAYFLSRDDRIRELLHQGTLAVRREAAGPQARRRPPSCASPST